MLKHDQIIQEIIQKLNTNNKNTEIAPYNTLLQLFANQEATNKQLILNNNIQLENLCKSLNNNNLKDTLTQLVNNQFLLNKQMIDKIPINIETFSTLFSNTLDKMNTQNNQVLCSINENFNKTLAHNKTQIDNWFNSFNQFLLTQQSCTNNSLISYNSLSEKILETLNTQ